MKKVGTLSVLLVEDDGRLASLTRDYLESHEVRVTVARDGPTGLDEARRHRFDVVLLDVMLPGMSGTEVLRRLREHSDVPVIMITARGEEADRVLGLEIGADDYVPKPFSPRELLARMHAVLRRTRGQVGPSARRLEVEGLELDPQRLSARLHGVELSLTAFEFTLLRVMAERAGRVLSREQLLELTRGNAEETFDRAIDVHVSRLRQKMAQAAPGTALIKTVRGAGYVFAGGES